MGSVKRDVMKLEILKWLIVLLPIFFSSLSLELSFFHFGVISHFGCFGIWQTRSLNGKDFFFILLLIRKISKLLSDDLAEKICWSKDVFSVEKKWNEIISPLKTRKKIWWALTLREQQEEMWKRKASRLSRHKIFKLLNDKLQQFHSSFSPP